MSKYQKSFLSRNGTKRLELILGVLIALALFIQPCFAVLSPNYIAKNQADKPLNSPGTVGLGYTLAYGDFLFVNDTTWAPGSVGETITSWRWNLTNITSDPNYAYSVIKNERNATFGPFKNATDSYLLNLTITASDSHQYSPYDMVYKVSDDRPFLAVDFYGIPAYDDRTIGNQNGTIQFKDRSHSILDPMMKVTEWWWKWTDLTTGKSDSVSGQDHFTIDMNNTELLVNLTVNSSQGNLGSISSKTKIPPDNVYPIANFSVIPMSGLAPFQIGITDQALSMVNYTVSDVPLSYNYTIWKANKNVFGKITTKNVNQTLSDPGVYHIIQNVTNSFGISHESSVDISVGNQKYPKASFTAVPMNGSYPLNVSFIDQSVLDPDLLATIGPANYTWNFDDGSDSHLQNPTHKFTEAGDYTVRMNLSHGGLQSGPYTQVIEVFEPSDSGINFTWVQEYGKTAYSAVLIPLGITADWKTNWSVTKDGIEYSSVTGSSGFTPRYDLPETGVYTVAMNASKDGFITRDISKSMEVFPNIPPNPEITMESPFDSFKYWAFAFPNQPIQFWSNASKSMEDSWLWDFGDTYTSNLRSPIHSYSVPGLYTVKLNASNVKGMNSAVNQYNYNVLILNQIEVMPFVDKTSGKVPLSVQFDADVLINGKSDPESRKYIQKWFWDFDIYTWEGMSSEERPKYTYNKPGVYTPWVYVYLKNDYFNYHPYPVSLITADPISPILPNFTYEMIDRNGTFGYSYKFMDVSTSYPNTINSWDWSFGDETPNATEPAPTHLYKEPGKYTVIMTVKDVVLNEDTTSRDLVVGPTPTLTPTPKPTPFIADFEANIVEGFEPLTVQFVDKTTGNPIQWDWNFGDGQTSKLQDPTHQYLVKGSYPVTLKCTDNNGNTAERINPDFITVSRIDFLANITTGQKPLVVEFTDLSSIQDPSSRIWNFGDNTGSIPAKSKIINHTYQDSGYYAVTLNITDKSGTSKILEKQRYITIN